MNAKFKPKQFRPSSIDSKLTQSKQFKRLLSKEQSDSITEMDSRAYSYKIELAYPSQITNTYNHYRIHYKVIGRQKGSSIIIKLENLVKTKSKLRKLVKTKRISKRTQMKWMPRLKIQRT